MTGAYRRFLPDGTLDHAEFYEKGKISGDYWPNGQLKKKITKGKDGKVIEWFYPSGQLQKRYVTAKSGFTVEPVRLWHENGQLAEELHLKEDDRFGPWLKFFEDGQPKLQARYEKDERLVIENAWDDDRRQIVKQGTGTYVEDKLKIDWQYDLFWKNDWVRSLPFRRGKLHGKGFTWHDGVLWSEDHYKDGKQDGEHLTYYDNGRINLRQRFRAGKLLSEEQFPKFDNPQPVVLVEVEVNAERYASWKKPLPDEYPQPKNLAKLQASLPIPQFLADVYQRNLTKTVTDDYEDVNSFKDGAYYFLRINERGEVEKVEFTGCSAYSISVAETYLPILKQLRFTPARHRGKKIPGWALARIEHTFVEAGGK
jgi:antitoxin component YwqK of YwqJK toxin-antitoxin module